MELRVRNLPEDLEETLRAMVKRDRVSMRVAALMLLRVGQSVDSMKGQTADKVRTKREQSVQRFVPPTVEEANAEIVARGYHFEAEQFVAWNGSRGWKTRQGPMKDWKQAMVTWESRWKESQQTGGEHGQQRRVSAAAARTERNRQNIVDAFTDRAGDAAGPDGDEREDGGGKRLTR